MKAPIDSEPLVDCELPAQLIGLKERAFWDAVHKQNIPRYVINRRVIRFKMSEVEEWLASRRKGDA
jgi:predicted DNA-binding transcriptional regulator AlpA